MTVIDRQRLEYLDIAKGIGIILVVAGHVFSGPLKNAIYLFHMPMFFMLVGMTPKAFDMTREALLRRTFWYLVSVVAYVFIISILCILVAPSGSLIERVKHGYGEGYFVVLWFMVALIISSWGLHFTTGLNEMNRYLFGLFLLLLSYLVSNVFMLRLPLGALVSLHAMPLMLLGEAGGKFLNGTQIRWPLLFGLLGCVLGGAYPGLDYNMKEGVYGIPFVSLVLAVCASLAIVTLSQMLTSVLIAEQVFNFFGLNSLAVMFIHQPLQIIVRTFLPALGDFYVFCMAIMLVAMFVFVVSWAPPGLRKILAVKKWDTRATRQQSPA